MRPTLGSAAAARAALRSRERSRERRRRAVSCEAAAARPRALDGPRLLDMPIHLLHDDSDDARPSPPLFTAQPPRRPPGRQLATADPAVDGGVPLRVGVHSVLSYCRVLTLAAVDRVGRPPNHNILSLDQHRLELRCLRSA